MRPLLLLASLLTLTARLAAAGDDLPLILQPLVRVQPPTAEHFVKSVRPGHPRLLLTNARVDEIRRQIIDDPVHAGWMKSVRQNAAFFYAKEPIAFAPEPVEGQRAQVRPMLWPGRGFVDRVSTLGFLMLVDKDETAFNRLRKEVLNALDTWPHWDTDIARYEIACGMALAYDWAYARWTPTERQRLEDAITRHILVGYMQDFSRWTTKPTKSSSLARNNVNLVNNTGAAVAALALAHERPAEAGAVLRASFAMMQTSLAEFGDDGAWYEGVNYWRFGVRHLTQYLACLDTAIGDDFGLASGPAFPGIARTAGWPLQLCSPDGRPFNFGDGDSRVLYSAPLLWLGRVFNQPEAIAHERRVTLAGADDSFHRNLAREVVQRLIYDRPATLKPSAPLPLDAVFSVGDIAVMRTSWSDPAALFVGIKAGSAAGNVHAHLDAGTVVADALGRRWLCEVGIGPYEKRYFSSERFLFFQARTEGHGTLVINPEGPHGSNQSLTGRAQITLLDNTAAEGKCRVDLTQVYPDTREVLRTVSLRQDRSVLRIDDQVTLTNPGTVRWQVYTEAPKVSLAKDGRSVRLSYPASPEGKAAEAQLVLRSEDLGQRFVIETAGPLANSPAVTIEPLPGFTRVAIVAPTAVTTKITVDLIPSRPLP